MPNQGRPRIWARPGAGSDKEKKSGLAGSDPGQRAQMPPETVLC